MHTHHYNNVRKCFISCQRLRKVPAKVPIDSNMSTPSIGLSSLLSSVTQRKNLPKLIPTTSPQIVSLSSLIPHLRVLGFFYRLARRELHRNRTIFHLSLHSEHVQNCHMRGDGLWPTDFRIFMNSCAGYFSLVCYCVAHDVILTRVSPHVKRINDKGCIRGP